MSLVVVVALGLLSLAVAIAAPVADLELRQGRNTLRALSVEAAARGGLADLEQGRWIPAAGSVPVGGQIGLPAEFPRPGLSVQRRLWRIGPDLWLAESAATARDSAGVILAGSRQGLLLRIGVVPPDTLFHARVTPRPWVIGFQ